MARIYLVLASVVLFLHCQEASAQICRPVAERTGKSGVGSSPISPSGNSTRPETFWHLHVTRPGGLKQQKLLAHGRRVSGRIWLLTIADEGWRPPGGERVAEIGPLPKTAVNPILPSTWRRSLRRGWRRRRTRMRGRSLVHPSGETCLETPSGKQIGRAGGATCDRPGRAPDAPYGDWNGATPRPGPHSSRFVKARDYAEHDWIPKGLCKT